LSPRTGAFDGRWRSFVGDLKKKGRVPAGRLWTRNDFQYDAYSNEYILADPSQQMNFSLRRGVVRAFVPIFSVS